MRHPADILADADEALLKCRVEGLGFQPSHQLTGGLLGLRLARSPEDLRPALWPDGTGVAPVGLVLGQ